MERRGHSLGAAMRSSPSMRAAATTDGAFTPIAETVPTEAMS